MARLEAAIAERLETDAGVAALVADRIYPLRLPERPVLPAVTYRTVTAQRYSAMGDDRPEVGTRVQFDVWATRYNDPAAGARQVTAAVREATIRWSGTFAGVVIIDSFFLNETDLYQPDEDATHRVAIDVLVFHEE